MSDGWRDARKYLFWGCAALLLIPILAVLAVVARTWIPLRSAGAARADLERSFGAPETFAPELHGEVPPDRMEAFLEVRRSMMELCPQFETLEATLRRFDQEMTETEPPSGKEIVQVTSSFMEALGDLTPMVGRFFRERNEALIEAEMGLGEYTYIFTVAYGTRLTESDVTEMLFADGEPFSPDTRAALRSMLALQLGRVSAVEDSGDFRIVLEREISALEQDSGRVPWQDHLPEPILTSLAPYREQLDLQFCPETAGMATDPDPDRAMVIALE